MAIKIVTDSTSDLPKEIIDEYDITVVPVNVHFGTREYKDGVDLSADGFYELLTEGTNFPTTSQPSIGTFMDAYTELAKDADGIVSIHISSKLSGTYNAAMQAKEQMEISCPLEIVDSQQASMGLGMIALDAARVAQKAESTFDDVVNTANHALRRCLCIAMLDTLEYVHKGGRIGKARAMLGTLLRIRPMIIVREGEVHEFGKERTRNKALSRLQQAGREFSPLDELAVIYSTEPEAAHELAKTLTDILPRGKEPIIARFGPSLGTHLGPGAVGLAMLRV